MDIILPNTEQDITSYILQTIENCRLIVDVEIGKCVELSGDYLSFFKMFVSEPDWEPTRIFYNKSSLILTDIDDYEVIIKRVNNIYTVLKLECTEFNYCVYIINYSGNKRLFNLLKGSFHDKDI